MGRRTEWHSTAQHSTAQHSTAQHSTAQHSTAQHSTAQAGGSNSFEVQHKRRKSFRHLYGMDLVVIFRALYMCFGCKAYGGGWFTCLWVNMEVVQVAIAQGT